LYGIINTGVANKTQWINSGNNIFFLFLLNKFFSVVGMIIAVLFPFFRYTEIYFKRLLTVRAQLLYSVIRTSVQIEEELFFMYYEVVLKINEGEVIVGKRGKRSEGSKQKNRHWRKILLTYVRRVRKLKKILAIITGMLFVLGFAASAFAIHAEIPAESQAVVAKGETQITIGGDIRTRGEWNHATAAAFDPDVDTGEDVSGYDQRVRLDVDAKVAPNVEGFIQLESTPSDLDLNNNHSDVYRWGTNEGGATGIYAFGNTKQSGISILQAWILYKGEYAGVKIGHMPLYLGNKLFFDHSKYGDDAIVVFATPIKGLDVGALTIKFQENNSTGTFGSNSADQDAYVAYGAYTGEGWSASADATYVNINSGTTFASIINGGNPSGHAPSDVLNVGLRGNWNVTDRLVLRGDIEWQTGKLAKDAPGELDVKGYAALVGVDWNLGPVTLTLEGAMGSGDDDPTDGDFKTFVTSLGSDQHYSYIVDYRVPQGAGLQYGGLANTTYVKIAAAGNITPDLSYYGAFYWLQATEDVTVAPGKKEDSLGEEIDAKITYKLARNLNYWVEGGYLMSGDVYKAVIQPSTSSPDDVWDVRHGIELSF
jgi:hypothetical protein